MLNRHNAGYRQLLQRIKVVGAVGVTLLPFLAGGIAAEPFLRGGLPPGVASDAPSLTLISPLDGLTLETYGPAEPYDLLTRLRFGFTLDYEDNNRIAAERNWFVRHPDYLERVFTRAQRYLPYIAAEIERRGLPYELALLPIVESAYDPFAYSHGRAAGLWQMIPGTARRFGIKQNWWYDGRRDVVDSTRAALDYLEYLLELNDGDWLNAIASYNSGEGNVLRSVKRNRKAGKPEDFWNLKLPRETSMYVPKLLALVDIVQNPDAYNLTLPAVLDEPQFVVADIGSQLDLALAAELAGIEVDTVYAYNPGYNRWSTDPAGPHRLVLPVEAADTFTAALADVPEGDRVRWKRHKVKNGEAISQIALKYNTTVRQHDTGRSLPADPGGDEAAVRLQPERRCAACEDAEPQARRQQGRARRAQGREFLDHQPALQGHAPAARRVERHGAGRPPACRPQARGLDGRRCRFATHVADDIARWNNIDKNKILRPGQKLTMYVDVTRQSS
jgi:membrane-bound lytic murein transglycosylase D